jgi:hypothetical protein
MVFTSFLPKGGSTSPFRGIIQATFRFAKKRAKFLKNLLQNAKCACLQNADRRIGNNSSI